MNPDPKTAALLARTGAKMVPLVLLRREVLTPRLIELEFGGPVEDLVGLPGNDIMIDLPTPDPATIARRRYSIRTIDLDSNRLRLWIDQSSHGPGATWAASLPTGSAVTVIGPRGQVSLDLEADWHLFIGDLSFLSAAYAMAEAIEAPGQALFIFELEHEEDIVLPSLPEGVTVTLVLVERGERLANDPSGLLAALAALELPALDGHIYLGGELRVIAALRQALRDQGVNEDTIHAKSYWRLGVSNLSHGEPKKDD